MFELLQDPAYLPLLIAMVIWSIVWKGFALWRAARTEQKNWFIVLLVINTIGILEIIYLWKFAKPDSEEMVAVNEE